MPHAKSHKVFLTKTPFALTENSPSNHHRPHHCHPFFPRMIFLLITVVPTTIIPFLLPITIVIPFFRMLSLYPFHFLIQASPLLHSSTDCHHPHPYVTVVVHHNHSSLPAAIHDLDFAVRVRGKDLMVMQNGYGHSGCSDPLPLPRRSSPPTSSLPQDLHSISIGALAVLYEFSNSCKFLGSPREVEGRLQHLWKDYARHVKQVWGSSSATTMLALPMRRGVLDNPFIK